MEAAAAQTADDRMVRVTNNKPSLIHLPDVMILGDEKGASPRAMLGKPGRALMPGGNNVPFAEWEAAKKNKQVRVWAGLDKDARGKRIVAKHNGQPWLVEGGDTDDPEGPEFPDDLSARSPNAASLLVKATKDLNVLRRWHEAETRPEIKQIIAFTISGLVGSGAHIKASTPKK